MKEFYKLYIGESTDDGKPTNWTINGVVPRSNLKIRIKEVVSRLKSGMDLYIVTPTGEVKAFFRDGLDKVIK